jgi:DNA-binding NtrC family response regulator
MVQYEWPGNVRELENAIERAVALGSQDTLEVHDLPPAVLEGQEAQLTEESPAVPPVKSAVSNTDLEQLERVTIERVFEQVQGDKALAGKMLGISRATLYRKLKRYNIAFGKSASASL